HHSHCHSLLLCPTHFHPRGQAHRSKRVAYPSPPQLGDRAVISTTQGVRLRNQSVLYSVLYAVFRAVCCIPCCMLYSVLYKVYGARRRFISPKLFPPQFGEG